MGTPGLARCMCCKCSERTGRCPSRRAPVSEREQPENPGYSANLDAELVLTDVTKAQCSDVTD